MSMKVPFSFMVSNTYHFQWGFYHRGSPRSGNWFHCTFPWEYSNNVLHASNTTASNLETPLHARGTVNVNQFIWLNSQWFERGVHMAEWWGVLPMGSLSRFTCQFLWCADLVGGTRVSYKSCSNTIFVFKTYGLKYCTLILFQNTLHTPPWHTL